MINCRAKPVGLMKVGKSIQKAIDEWEAGDLESAMLHVCNAIDGTARKLYPSIGSNARFTRLLRENYPILGPMGAPGLNLEETRFPVSVPRAKSPDGKPDLADVIYAIHRCTHGHGDELPDGFDLLSDAGGPPRYTRMTAAPGKVRLSDRMIFGLAAVAILSTVNVDQRVPDGYHLTFGESGKLMINDWWGRRDDFLRDVIARDPVPQVKIDFGAWMR